MKIDSGTTAWMLTATALVLLMTPGLAFFYGGMTRAKSVLNMMMMSFVSIITVTIAWVIYGHSLAFTDNGSRSSTSSSAASTPSDCRVWSTRPPRTTAPACRAWSSRPSS